MFILRYLLVINVLPAFFSRRFRDFGTRRSRLFRPKHQKCLENRFSSTLEALPRKACAFQVSDHFQILCYLLGKDWSSPGVEMDIQHKNRPPCM